MNDQIENSGEETSADRELESKSIVHSRRVFLFKISVILNAALGAVLAVPLVGYLFGPASKRDSETGSWVDLGSLDGFPVGQTKLVNFQSPVSRLGDGDTAKVSCWVRRISTQSVQVFAVNCAHLGCPVRWFSQSRLFLCPCHGGAYYEDGSRASGPPERGLFEYKVRLNGNSLAIHSGNMPTLATQARCSEKPLIQIEPAVTTERSNPWQA
ncbi:QcrA and Rieske domain-containing protein [Acidicapsa ligni]|uniref:QcrA and Rieske domain-containing protein n=1 Tax=Acidicapsa ligni TaxID=542300 RepID=UPI0021DF644F|nr:Rieske 2Fe-2S domain-containing protein [Acidicapsa ligni]